MKLRDAAALALMGWYLIVPPPDSPSGDTVNLKAPLNQWVIYSAFDSADKSEVAARAFAALLLKAWNGWTEMAPHYPLKSEIISKVPVQGRSTNLLCVC